MPVYAEAAAGYRDTTKWLTALLPVAALTATAVTLGPALVESATEATGVTDFLSESAGVVVATMLGLMGVVCVVVSASMVLSVEPTDIGALYADKRSGPELVKALGAGALAPHYLDQPSFDAALTALSAAQAANDEAATKSHLERLAPATEILNQWAVFRVMRRRFRWFLGWFVLGSSLVVAALLVGAASLPQGSAIDSPVLVEVQVDKQGALGLDRATGCTDPGTTTFVAVSGTWDRPELAVSGPGCVTANRWRPDLDHVLVAPAS